MVKPLGVFMLAVGLALCGTSALAQRSNSPPPSTPGNIPPGVLTPETQSRSSGALQREFDNRRLTSQLSDPSRLHSGAASIAGCLARRGGDRAGDFLGGSLAGDPDYKRIEEALTGRYSNCAANVAAATAMAISGALAEELLAKQAPAFPDRASGVSEEAAHRFFGDLSGSVTFDNIAGCLAVYSPGLVYKLIRTDVGSSEETAALRAVYGQTPECRMSAPPDSVPALDQRFALATALYEWTKPRG